MKKIISMFFVVAVLFSSCSGDPVSQDESANGAASKSIVASPQAEKLFGRVMTNTGDIRGRDCKGGLGLCTPRVESAFVYDMRVFQSPFDVLKPTYDAVTDKVTAVAAEDGNAINFYFPKDAVNSVSKVASDFDFFTVDQVVLASHYQLVAGSYPKKTEGDYFVYKVLFIKI